MTDPLHPKTAQEAAEAFMRGVQQTETYCQLTETLLSVLAGVDTHDTNLRDHPAAWAAVERYAEALAAQRVAQERERWTDAVMSELDSNGQAEAIVRCVTGQPHETGK